jgi:UDP-glucose 4-epimerase
MEKKVNYLVTGSCGFLGSNLVDMLIEQGHKVVGIDNLSSDAHDQFYFNPNATYYHYDVNDYVMCSDVFERHKPNAVFHLAAEARIQNCIEDPSLCMETNLMGTQTMLQLSRKEKVKRMVFMSTSAVYGLRANPIQKEEDKTDCLNPYSLSKWFGENLCKMYSKNYGLDTVCFRGFNIYGDRQPKKGQYAPVIGIFKRQKEAGDALTVVGDGEQRRDFIHVSDVCRGLMAGAFSKETQNGEVYNLGTGKNYSVNEIAEMIGGKRDYLPQRQSESRSTLADISKAKEKLGWIPQYDLPSKIWA